MQLGGKRCSRCLPPSSQHTDSAAVHTLLLESHCHLCLGVLLVAACYESQRLPVYLQLKFAWERATSGKCGLSWQ